MGTTNLGRVVPINKGEYSASETYEQNHVVRYGTATYWHYGLQPTTGVAPTDETVWRLVAQDGEAGSTWDAIAEKPFDSVGDGLTVDADGSLNVEKPDSEIYIIAPADWTALSGAAPFTYSATVTATHTIGADTICELVNDNAVLFATYGFAIGAVSGQNVTIYAIGKPSNSVTLEVNYYG